MEPLYIKTFSDLKGIVYQEAATRPARGLTILGIGLLIAAAIFIFDKSLQAQRPFLIIVFIVIMAAGFLTFYLRLSPIRTEVAKAAPNIAVLETPYSFDGGKDWFSLGPLAGVIASMIILAIVKSYFGLESASGAVIIAGILALSVGVSLAIGLNYLYLEQKFDRVIMIYRYDRIKN